MNIPNVRLDRMATLYFFYPLRLKVRPAGMRIPILMYHSISESGENGIHPYFRTCTSPGRFAEQMRFLHENGYTIIPLKEVMRYLEPGGKTAKRCAVITFDDGFRDFYTEAFPVMERYGYTATVFLPTSFIGAKERGFRGREHLSWEEVRELRKKGITFGSHTVTHPELKSLDKQRMEDEIRGSKEEIEDRIGEGIDSFSYPFAFPEEDRAFVSSLRQCLEKCGYGYGVSTMIGTASKGDDVFFMKRLPVNTCDDTALFMAKLEGGYDWLSRPQSMVKSIKRLMRGR